MKIELNTLSIRILLKCSNGIVKNRDVSQFYHRESKKNRDKALKGLIEKDYINKLILPKPGTNKPPIFYEITEKGKKWVVEYTKSYPKSWTNAWK